MLPYKGIKQQCHTRLNEVSLGQRSSYSTVLMKSRLSASEKQEVGEGLWLVEGANTLCSTADGLQSVRGDVESDLQCESIGQEGRMDQGRKDEQELVGRLKWGGGCR